MRRLSSVFRSYLARGLERYLLSVVLAAALAVSATLRLGPAELRVSPWRWAVMAVLALLLVLPVLRLVSRGVEPRLRAYSRRGRYGWVLGSLATAALLSIVTPIVTPPVPIAPASAQEEREPTAASSASDSSLEASNPEPALSVSAARVYRRVLRTADFLGLGFLLLVVGLSLASWPGPRRGQAPLCWGWLVASGFCASVWSIYVLAFWPAFMSSDSVDQWSQMLHGPIINHHPAFHTMLIWLLTRVWESPAVVALAQVLALSTVFGLAVKELSHWGVPRWLLALMTVGVALSPVHGSMVTTLWKDIAYSIAHLWLFTLLLTLVRTRGEALRSTPFLVLLMASLSLVALLRHNGVPVAALTLLLLGVIAPRALRRRVLFGALGVVGAYVLVVGPLFRVLDVKPPSSAFLHSIQIHQMGAIAHAEREALPLEDRQLLEAIQPYEIWRDQYTCYAVDPLLYSGKLKGAFFTSPAQKDFIRMWLRQVREHWRLIFEHQACVSSLVWRIRQRADGYLYTFNPSGIAANTLGLKMESKWSWMQEKLWSLLFATREPELVWWVWRPALYLYLALFASAMFALRLRRAWGLVPVVPVLLNSLSLLALNVVQDFRYQYPAYAVSLVGLGLLFARRDAWAVEVAAPSASHLPSSEPVGAREQSSHAAAS
ncbi:DUF6020 family protein [Archangium sp.]|uniref:DUF6020 family protein n=1 Tax=Archangium sp. TaxID=1872627 RepID=UPI00389A1D2F